MSDVVEMDIPVEYSFFGTAKRSRIADWRTARTTVKAPVRILRSDDAEGYASPDETWTLAPGKTVPLLDGAPYVPVLRSLSGDSRDRSPLNMDGYGKMVPDFRTGHTFNLDIDPFGFDSCCGKERTISSEWKKKFVVDDRGRSSSEDNLATKTALALRAAGRMAFIDDVLHTSRWEIAAGCRDPVSKPDWSVVRVDLLDPVRSFRMIGNGKCYVRFDKICSVLPGVAVRNSPGDLSHREFEFRDFDHLAGSAMHRFLSMIHPSAGNDFLVTAWSPNWPSLTEDVEEAVHLCRKTLKRTMEAFVDPVATAGLRSDIFATLETCALATAAINPSRLGPGGVQARDSLAAFLRHPEERWKAADIEWEETPRASRRTDPVDEAALETFSM